MNELTETEKAWLAGLYEGEGSCSLRARSGVRVEVQMTDADIVQRVLELVGIGTITTKKLRNPKYKPVTCFAVGGYDALDLLTAIKPWLGIRRSKRVTEAFEHHAKPGMIRKGDKFCIHGHEMTPQNTAPETRTGRCLECRRNNLTRYRANKKSRLL